MESLFQTTVDALLKLVNAMPVQNYEDELSLIQFRLRQLEPYVVAQFQFDTQDVQGDIKDYTALLQEYRYNVGDKIDFLIDIGKDREGWDHYISLHIEEVLAHITDTVRDIVK